MVRLSCQGQSKEELMVKGEWEEYKSEAYDVQKWMKPYEGPNFHIKLFSGGKGEEWTYYPEVVEKFDYRIEGKHLFIRSARFAIDTLTENELVILSYKGGLDIENDNPYSAKIYLKKLK